MEPSESQGTGEQLAGTPPIDAVEVKHEVTTALRNGLMLAASLMATWTVAVIVRFFLPRYLGPEPFGLLSFADSFAGAALGAVTLGIEAHIRRVIPVKPESASDFFGGVLLIRVVLGVAVLSVLQLTVALTGRPADVQRTVLAFGVGYVIFQMNNAYAALLQANTTVKGLAIANVVGKVLWGALLGAGMVRHVSIVWFAMAFAVSEGTRCAWLQWLARRQLHLRWRWQRANAFSALWASLPFWANALVLNLAGRLDVTILSFRIHDDRQVGWYSAASNLAMLTFLLSPLMISVLLPLLTRAWAVSEETMWTILRRTVVGLVMLASPIALFVALGAEVWIRLVFGGAFAPAAMSLRIQAPLFVFTYFNAALSMVLFVRNKGWTLTAISAVGVVVNPVVAVTTIPLFARALGPGGAGVGSGLGVLMGELAVCVFFLYHSPNVVDSSFRRTVGVTVLTCAATTAVHVWMSDFGPVRLVLDALVYVVLGTATGALRPRELLALVREVRGRKGAP